METIIAAVNHKLDRLRNIETTVAELHASLSSATLRERKKLAEALIEETSLCLEILPLLEALHRFNVERAAELTEWLRGAKTRLERLETSGTAQDTLALSPLSEIASILLHIDRLAQIECLDPPSTPEGGEPTEGHLEGHQPVEDAHSKPSGDGSAQTEEPENESASSAIQDRSQGVTGEGSERDTVEETREEDSPSSPEMLELERQTEDSIQKAFEAVEHQAAAIESATSECRDLEEKQTTAAKTMDTLLEPGPDDLARLVDTLSQLETVHLAWPVICALEESGKEHRVLGSLPTTKMILLAHRWHQYRRSDTNVTLRQEVENLFQDVYGWMDSASPPQKVMTLSLCVPALVLWGIADAEESVRSCGQGASQHLPVVGLLSDSVLRYWRTRKSALSLGRPLEESIEDRRTRLAKELESHIVRMRNYTKWDFTAGTRYQTTVFPRKGPTRYDWVLQDMKSVRPTPELRRWVDDFDAGQELVREPLGALIEGSRRNRFLQNLSAIRDLASKWVLTFSPQLHENTQTEADRQLMNHIRKHSAGWIVEARKFSGDFVVAGAWLAQSLQYFCDKLEVEEP